MKGLDEGTFGKIWLLEAGGEDRERRWEAMKIVMDHGAAVCGS